MAFASSRESRDYDHLDDWANRGESDHESADSDEEETTHEEL